MPGFIDIVSFPTSDGALHQVYANVHEETDAKLSLEFDRPFLRTLLLILRSRREEKLRRMGRRPFDVTLGVFNHPSVDGDSMGLAFAITEHIASCVGANPPRADGSLALDGIPRIIATGEIDENGTVQTVGGMDAKLAGVLDAIESGAELPEGIFVFPAAAKTPSVARLIRDLKTHGWSAVAVTHIDDVVPIWQATPRPREAGPGVWTRWKRPLKLGSAAAIAFTVFAALFSAIEIRAISDGEDEGVGPSKPEVPGVTGSVPRPTADPCADVPYVELSACILRHGTGNLGLEK